MRLAWQTHLHGPVSTAAALNVLEQKDRGMTKRGKLSSNFNLFGMAIVPLVGGSSPAALNFPAASSRLLYFTENQRLSLFPPKRVQSFKKSCFTGQTIGNVLIFT